MGRLSDAQDRSFEEAFDELFRRATASARRILGDVSRAEDAAAEALARAYSRWDEIEHLAHRDAWVLRVAMNLALDQTRRKVPWLRVIRIDDRSDEAALRLALVAALGTLPKRQREAIALRYLTDLPEAEVAAALRVSVGTIKTHLHRGVASLRERLGPDLELGEVRDADTAS